MTFLFISLAVLVVLYLLVVRFMYGEDLSVYDRQGDSDVVQVFVAPGGPSAEHDIAAESIAAFVKEATAMPEKQGVGFIRGFMDNMSHGREYACQFVPADAGGVPAEWVLAPGVDPSRRVLYIHGGAFFAGSPVSHRTMSTRFSELANAAVLVIDYRLMPEHPRMDGISDCHDAYRWILDNGPDGPAPVSFLLLGGDSAGGNLALSLAAWVRDDGLRSADALIAFSPAVDSTFSSPSMRANIDSDIMLGPQFGALMKIPRFFRILVSALKYRVNPASPLVSPVFADLANLPPILIQASGSEMLLDDARRYVRKAHASGSPARVQVWPDMLHVWQIFYPNVPEAAQAWQEVGKFLQELEAA